jgi:hypothetical protein
MRTCKKLLIVACLLSCGTHEESTNWTPRQEINQKYADMLLSYDSTKTTPCDEITFHALFDAYGTRQDDLYEFENPAGKWNRSYRIQCYESGESRSQCSLDGYLSVLHALVGRDDYNGIRRMRTYLQGQDWICGLGTESATDISNLRGLIDLILGEQSLKTDDTLPVLEDFRGYLVANYLWLKGRVKGSINSLEYAALGTLAGERMQEPLFHALYHRFKADGQEYTESLLLDWRFNPDWWGSCPEEVMYVISVGAMN